MVRKKGYSIIASVPIARTIDLRVTFFLNRDGEKEFKGKCRMHGVMCDDAKLASKAHFYLSRNKPSIRVGDTQLRLSPSSRRSIDSRS